MLLLVVRHGHAGTKRHWHADDRLRPLTQQGFEEADALVDVLSPFAPVRVLSSPYLRCVQTVTPCAEALGIRIERSKRLTPSSGGSAGLLAHRISRNDPGPIVFCTHGEVIHDLQEDLIRQAPDLFGADQPREKASVWVLERQAGRFVSARYVAPSGME